MKYILDTDICIYIVNKKSLELAAKVKEHRFSEICISSITLSELEYGVEKSSFPERNRAYLNLFLTPIKVLPYDDNSALEYGKVRSFLESSGQVIGSLDMLIASQCLSLKYTLVTNNDKEFKRVPGLRVANWIKDL